MSGDDPVEGLLTPFWDKPDQAGVFSDFDGTLAPIVDDPAEARPQPGAVEVLDRLARRFARVGVVSGRPLSFLTDRLGGHGLLLSGLYGLERMCDDQVETDDEAERWRPAIDDVSRRAADELPSELLVETKGLTVAVHFRTAPALDDVAREWAEREAARTDLALVPGRRSYELRPPVPSSKGTSLAALLDGLRVACFVGDDHGDLPAFDALDDVVAAGGHVMRVGVRTNEAPDELLDRADLVLDDPGHVVDLLERLASGP